MRDGRNHMGIFSLFCLVSFIRPVKQREIRTRTQTHMECDDLCSNTTSCCVRLLLFWESVCLSLPSWCQLLCIVSKEDLTVISFQAFFFFVSNVFSFFLWNELGVKIHSVITVQAKTMVICLASGTMAAREHNHWSSFPCIVFFCTFAHF